MQGYPLADWGYASAKVTHAIVEAERYAFADRNTYLGDPAFVQNPVADLVSPDHAAKIRSRIKPDRATPSSEVQGSLGAAEGMHTTHYSIVDAAGNAVAVTYTINFFFGTGRIAGDTGFFLNNEMDDFTSKPGVANAFGLVQGSINQVEPGKRPLSSMTPTIVLKDGKLSMVTGSPGGSTIISTVLETILNVVDFGMNMQQAVDAPRLHHQWLPDTVSVEPGYLTPETQALLEAMGYSFKERSPGARTRRSCAIPIPASLKAPTTAAARLAWRRGTSDPMGGACPRLRSGAPAPPSCWQRPPAARGRRVGC